LKDTKQLDKVLIKCFSYNVVMYFNVFGAFVEILIGSNLIITQKEMIECDEFEDRG